MIYSGGSFVNFTFVFLCFYLSVHGQTVQNAKDLRTALFTTGAYDYRVRPITDQSGAINVTIDFKLLNVNEIDEVEESMKTTGYLSVYWIDNELTWTAATYGGLQTTFIPQDEVWKPDIALKNSYTSFKDLGSSKLNVEISNQGNVEWYPFQVFRSTCSIVITYFPFDVQHCSLHLVAWSYGKDEVNLESNYGIDLTEYEDNPTWDLVDTSFSTEQSSSDAIITFRIKLKRKPLYTLMSIVFPILVLTILNLFVFVLPCESGEKSGYAVTVFLTFVVFLTIVEANMPKNSSSVAIFSVFIIIMTSQSTIITMIALAMVRCCTFDENITPIPKWLIALARIGKFKPCRERMRGNKVDERDNEDDNENKKDRVVEISVGKTEKHYTWKQVINGLDCFCFLFFMWVSILVTLLCLGISAGVAATE